MAKQFGARSTKLEMYLLYGHFVIANLLWLIVAVSADETSFPLTDYQTQKIQVPSGHLGAEATMRLMIPIRPGERRIADPITLFAHVEEAWNVVVEKNQAGLVDAKLMHQKSPPMTEHEAFHHYISGKAGIIDSARFLVTFNVVPSIQTGGSALHLSALHDDAKRIEHLLDDPSLQLEVDEEKIDDGATPLYFASAMGAVKAARSLLGRGADPNRPAGNGATPLMVASAMGHVEVVNVLVANHADPNAAHPFAGTTALHFAAEMGRVETIEALCRAGARANQRNRVGGSPIHTAADTNQTLAVRALLESPCDASPNLLLNGDTSPLYLAAQRGFADVLSVLLGSEKVNPNFAMPSGRFRGEVMGTGESTDTPPAYKPKNTEIGNGATALHAAVENGWYDAVRVLLDAGATQLASMEGASPLLIALQYRHPKIALLLLQVPNARESALVDVRAPQDGAFPLFVAAGAGYDVVVRRLLDVGANPMLRTRAGHSALEYAEGRGRHKAAGLLRSALRHSRGL